MCAFMEEDNGVAFGINPNIYLLVMGQVIELMVSHLIIKILITFLYTEKQNGID